MTDPHPTRRDLLKPVQLIGFAFIAAAFAGVITLVTMGFFQTLTGDQRAHVIVVALIVAGIAFIVTLVGIALLILAVDPAEMSKPVDRPVLMRKDDRPADPDTGAPRP
ncbi:amino acid transporter [Microbacterium saccharophilum]|uniref:Amino acid transporter n=1 Tax=Microbacterium saccharophilum TaxID=1213358 RepID=A0A5C8I6I6_9MICO|nr:amino acid transporter [Microbacterium saccharophilum]TXK15041.1 amino acid transporter [Microbacterium saccharophilum]GEP47448.1 hypothetical protein MSA03_09560 [Microbacterium saccharophilum]